MKNVTVIEENDFQQLAVEMKARSVALVLEFHADECPYCRMLEEEFLKPMLRNPEYAKKVLIRKVKIDSHVDIIDFSGAKIQVGEFSRRYGAILTPTLVFLDSDGREVAERIVGINTPELFGGYVDMAINRALMSIRR